MSGKDFNGVGRRLVSPGRKRGFEIWGEGEWAPPVSGLSATAGAGISRGI